MEPAEFCIVYGPNRVTEKKHCSTLYSGTYSGLKPLYGSSDKNEFPCINAPGIC